MKNIQKRIMIVGASELQIPAIKKAKELGMSVGVIDWNPQAKGVSLADKYFKVSTIDEEGVYLATKEFKADGIMTLATDMPMRAIAYTAEKLKLESISYQTAINSTDKAEMIKVFEQHDVAHPWYFIIESLEDLSNIKDKIKFPCISKPVDSAGSRGVSKISCIEDLEASFLYSQKRSKSKKVIIEEFLEGKEVSVEIIVVDGTPHIIAVTDKLTTGEPNFIELGHSQHTIIPSDQSEKIKILAKKSIKALGINTGPAHVEIMLTINGPKMIEIGARLGGDYITSHLVPLSTGIDLVEATIKLACREPIDIRPKYIMGSAMRSLIPNDGKLVEIFGIEEAGQVKGVKEIIVSKSIGDNLTNTNDSGSRLIYVISQGKNSSEAIEIAEKALNLIQVIIDRSGVENAI